MTPRQPTDLHALRLLQAIVVLEDAGEDPYEAGEALAAQLGLSAEAFEACVERLVTGGYVHGGMYFSGPFVDGTTERGRRAVSKSRAIETALDHVLDELDGIVKKGEWHDAPSGVWSKATWIRGSADATGLDIIDALIDHEGHGDDHT